MQSGAVWASNGKREVHYFLRERSDALPQIDAIALIAADGKLVNSSRVWPVQSIDLSDRDYFKRVQLDGGPGVFISAPEIDSFRRLVFFDLARRINSANGEFVGLVLSAIDVQYLEDFFRSISLRNGASVAVFRRDGTMLARYPHIETWLGGKLPKELPFYGLLEEGGGDFRSPGYVDGLARVVSVHPLRDFPLVITVSTAEDAVLVDWRRQSLFIALGTLCAAIGFALFFARWSPIRARSNGPRPPCAKAKLDAAISL